MSAHTRQPRWWQLYALIPAVVGLFVAENGLRVSRLGHEGVQFGVVVVVFGFVQWWLSANRHELMEAERRQAHDLGRGNGFHARELITGRTEDQALETPMFRLPPTGLRHTLEDTFDLDMPESNPAHRPPA
jgi:hypothetical protein